MVRPLLITGAELVNEGRRYVADVLVVCGRISRIASHISDPHADVISAQGSYLFPGLIDTHVHFREPGHPHKGTIEDESKAAVLGGVTSFLEMPNTAPPTINYALLEEKYALAACNSVANYGFYIGATKDNVEELLKLPVGAACGVKVFMGSSTGSLLVDDESVLERIFSEVRMIISVHCEEESIILQQQARYKKKPHEQTAADHQWLRPRAACLASTKKAIALAQAHHAKLHILHITTAEELQCFSTEPLAEKHITAEACLHQLLFCSDDYPTQGNRIKVNPSIKKLSDKEALWKGLHDGRLDILGSDHAPHSVEEKQLPYYAAPSGAPMVQHSLYALLEAYKEQKIDLELIVEKFSHNPARRFGIVERGFLREGYHADLVLVKSCAPWRDNCQKHS